MKINQSEILEKTVIGRNKSNNTPVIYIKTAGGLNAIFINDNGEIKAAGAAPHKAIAVFLAEKTHPSIEWDRSKL